MSTIKFGTSGWRAIVADEFTVANIRLAVAGIAAYVKTQPLPHRVLVGRDPRFLGESFVAEAASVLAAAGITPIVIPDAAPTPAIAYAVHTFKTSGAINFTASHNPPEYNGIKFSTHDGAPALPEVTRQIEAAIAAFQASGQPVPKAPAPACGFETADVKPAFLARLAELVDLKAIAKSGIKIVCDPFWGAGRGYSSHLLAEAGVTVESVHDYRDVLFGGHAPEPDDHLLGDCKAKMKEIGAALGIATDGDADRFGIVDADGTFIQPNYVIALLFDYLVETRGWRNGVAKSVATTNLINALADYHHRRLQIHRRAHHCGQDRHRRRRVRRPHHPRPRSREGWRHCRPADCGNGGRPRQIPRRPAPGAICQGWFLLSRSRKLPLDPRGQSRVH